MTDPFETRLETLAKDFSYPETPRVAQKAMARLQTRPAPRVLSRRLAWGIAIILLFAGLMSVPPVRAAVLEFIRIGVVRIFPAPEPAPGSDVPRTALPEVTTPMTVTPAMRATSLIPFLEQLSGETSLDQARSQVGFPIPLPAYPLGLGQPNHVFVQDTNGWMVVLVWLEADDPSRVRMSLHVIEEGSWVLEKYQPVLIQRTSVNGQPAVWAEGEYPLRVRNGNIEWTRLIEGHVLIWTDGNITYRLETNLPLEEAVRIAGSLR